MKESALLLSDPLITSLTQLYKSRRCSKSKTSFIAGCITHGSLLKDVPGLVGFLISQTMEQEGLKRGIGVIVLGLLEFTISHNGLGLNGVSQD